MLIFGRSLVRQNFKSISLDNQSYLPRVTLNGADTDDLRNNPFMVSLVKCDGSYNTHEAPFAVLYVPSRIDNVNVKVFNMITGINTRRWRPDV